jgi:membrane associated rhomboid family serine protease
MWLLEVVLGSSFIWGGIFSPTVAIVQPWRFITSIFMHDPSSPLHLFFNMFAFVNCAPIFERIFRRTKFIAIFIGSGILGNIALWLWYSLFPSAQLVLSFGASGAVFGLFGGLIILYKRLGANANGILMSVGLNLLICFWIANIAWQAHIGGLVAGIGITYLFLNYTKNRTL